MAAVVPGDRGTDQRNVVSVEYWVRLLLTEGVEPAPEAEGAKKPKQLPREFWTTHPILLLPGNSGV